MDHYAFPCPDIKANGKPPLVLVACGSFSPITFMHLRLFEMAKDKLQEHFNVIAGYISPVHDSYNKSGLLNSTHRLEMCKRAVESSEWLYVDAWEVLQSDWQRTKLVLEHFHKHLCHLQCEIMLLAGADLVYSFITPDLWDRMDVESLLVHFGIVVIERKGTDLWEAILEHDHLYAFKVLFIHTAQATHRPTSHIQRHLSHQGAAIYKARHVHQVPYTRLCD